jgi:cysteine desulfuration protein SufE
VYDTCIKKQSEIKALFKGLPSDEAKYAKIIDLGKALPAFPLEAKTPINEVKGCQSIMHLLTNKEEGKLYFQAESDALISKGLAALLIAVYSGESPEAILKCPPTYLEEIGITASLTPNRANGLYSIHLRMKQEALKALIN